MKRLITIICSISLLAVFCAPFTAQAAFADNSQALCVGSGGTWTPDSKAGGGGVCSTAGDKRTVLSTIQQVTNVLIFITGAIAVLMIIVGGVRYVVSAGDQAALSSAKNTIMYSLIGLIVAIMAYAIVNFVIGAFGIK